MCEEKQCCGYFFFCEMMMIIYHCLFWVCLEAVAALLFTSTSVSCLTRKEVVCYTLLLRCFSLSSRSYWRNLVVTWYMFSGLFYLFSRSCGLWTLDSCGGRARRAGAGGGSGICPPLSCVRFLSVCLIGLPLTSGEDKHGVKWYVPSILYPLYNNWHSTFLNSCRAKF